MTTEQSRHKHVLLLGEALVDLTEQPLGDALAFVPHPGGSPLNVAVGLSRLGVRSALGAIVADDALGKWLQAFLIDEGLDAAWLVPSGSRTTVSLAVLRDGEPQYSFYPDHPVPFTLDWSSRVRTAPLLAVHAGSIGLLEPRVAAEVVDLFSHTSLLRTFDPNVRPSLITDRAEYCGFVETMSSMSNLVKLSVEDAQFLYPREHPDDVAAHLLALGATAVVLTRAAEGASAWSKHGRADVPTSGLPVRDTTVGGDATMAALIADLVRTGLPSSAAAWDVVLRRARRIAGLACSRPGGAESMPRRYEFDAVDPDDARDGHERRRSERVHLAVAE